ncbi:reverse transcriptase [Lasius niger]|uniref:Reverse transcriptase n=1 Tax=Lasius niger TaxID=67767 RepID=A0A0J7K5D1_LASNI|nr:reverse transcriptase [Lasius niger]
MNLDTKLKWNEHIKKKKAELNIKYRQLYWLLGRNSELSVENKIRIYNQILKPVWTYGIQIWGCSRKTNVKQIQIFQNKVLRGIVNAPWYVRNSDLHRDLRIELVTDVTKKYAINHNL